jgi:hypothetical protein
MAYLVNMDLAVTWGVHSDPFRARPESRLGYFRRTVGGTAMNSQKLPYLPDRPRFLREIRGH